jgi:rSAM/selenodomain-associated transferase 2
LSVVLPVLNAAASLPATLAALGNVDEIVLADGGSSDGTASLPGLRIVAAPRGRGVQLIAGAKAARGDWLLFLHADTVLSPGWQNVARRFMADPANVARAGYFELAFASPAPDALRVARLANWRARTLGLPYGDQGLLISRRFYDALGGYAPLPLMEDVDFVRRIGKPGLVALDAVATTSAARYERDGWLARPLRNLFCLALYYLGVSPHTIAGLYR